MWKKVVLGVLAALGVAVLGLVIVAVFQPDTMRVERSRLIAQPMAALEPFATDLRKSHSWSPWAELDPQQQLTFSDPPSGVGAWYTWSGNDQVGKGKMSIRTVEEGRVEYDLEFLEPFESTADVAIAFAREGTATRVTWSFVSPQPFVSKLLCLFVDMDAMLGKDFEKGLENLERAVVASRP